MENEIIKLEKNYWQGMEDHDYETVKQLTRFPCTVAGKNGVMRVDENEFKHMFDSGSGADIRVTDISMAAVEVFGNSAIIGYTITIGSKSDAQKQPMQCACTSTWIKEQDSWRCAMHTESELVQE
ncbi:DUF4440 domain-containing protein [Flavobacterium magnum]|uniref:DUF4440 domain-containing protein n=1 Tax=Flavobacterium magnum TaxID=2162713 RepID=A0A2S0RHB1_9FLAO|nr:nuclear transport factor 2 family protein [Flavobacterium magnum]AWA30112.1 DUF4440 domain-containing protein [Flavobacterium magnum]